jgi:hypothetical protein
VVLPVDGDAKSFSFFAFLGGVMSLENPLSLDNIQLVEGGGEREAVSTLGRRGGHFVDFIPQFSAGCLVTVCIGRMGCTHCFWYM